jgi:HK97 family phage major capsid protein
MGYPIYTHEAMPVISSDSDAKVAIFGDLKSGYRIVDHSGMRMKRHDNGDVMIHERIGGSVLRPDAIRILKVSADEHVKESA